jgi:hypothetical protein
MKKSEPWQKKGFEEIGRFLMLEVLAMVPPFLPWIKLAMLSYDADATNG